MTLSNLERRVEALEFWKDYVIEPWRNPYPAPPQPRAREQNPFNRFDCSACGQGVAADEDGSCASCGRDCILVENGDYVLPEPTPPQPSEQEKCCAVSGTYACVCNRYAVPPQAGGDGVPVESLQRIVDYYFSFDDVTHTPQSVDAIEDEYRTVRAWLASRRRG